jgi:hypothetical protein
MHVGWAVIKNSGLIVINTVSRTRRAAIINWLVTEVKQKITNAHTNEQIENIWEYYSKAYNTLVSKVEIKKLEET